MTRHLLCHRGSTGPALLDPDLTRSRARWLCELVSRFGPDSVARWSEPPRGWDFDSWRRRRRLRRRAV